VTTSGQAVFTGLVERDAHAAIMQVVGPLAKSSAVRRLIHQVIVTTSPSRKISWAPTPQTPRSQGDPWSRRLSTASVDNTPVKSHSGT
jgi:hypothetical protein